MSREWYCKGKSLQEEIRQTCLPDFLLAIWYIGQMGTIVKWKDNVICFDPVLNDLKNSEGISRRNYERPFEPESWMEAEYIIGSHAHADHINLETLLPMAEKNQKVKFIVPETERKELIKAGIDEIRVIGAKAGKKIYLNDGMILYPIAAAHEVYVKDIEGNDKNLGYVLECEKQKVYHAGDTVLTEKLIQDVKSLGAISIACIPINGIDFERRRRRIIGNMNYRDAAFFSQQIEADITIPMHYDMVMGNEENPLYFADYMQNRYPGRKYHIMQLGERMIYGGGSKV